MHSSRVFWIKLIRRLFYEVRKMGSHTISYQSLLLSTIILNDMHALTVFCYYYIPTLVKLIIIYFYADMALIIRDQDYLRLQLLETRGGWLGCPDSVCDLGTCSTNNNNYANFGVCRGEQFQIIGQGTPGSPIKCGHLIRLRYVDADNSWLGYAPVGSSFNRHSLGKNPCPGSNQQSRNFRRCGAEMFIMYARGRVYGETIYNGDVVMVYQIVIGRYVSIQGKSEGDDTSFNFCPGKTPPAYLSYAMCSKNAFRIYRKP